MTERSPVVGLCRRRVCVHRPVGKDRAPFVGVVRGSVRLTLSGRGTSRFGGGALSTGDRRDDKRRVLDATDIVRLIGEHLALKAKGREYVGLCPFHDDHKPSMCVVPHKQIYHCFSCGAGGDALSFVMNYHRMSFREALEFLAQRAQIELTPWRPSGAGRAGSGGGTGAGGYQTDDSVEASGEEISRSDLLAANQTACAFFKTILNHAEHGRAAREVIERRQISPAMAEAFMLGASADRWDGLLLTVTNKGLDPRVFREAGLLKARDSGGLYDVFRNRLMFPITDQIGRVVAFGARRINDEDEPKYLNSPETRLFNKSQTLYGLFQASQSLRQQRVAIVTEGYMDTIACHQAGVTNAVATLGTALTVENARILRRLADTVVLLFDGDEAGQKAAERAVEVFFAEPIDVRIAMLSSATDAKDPDELLKRPDGREVLDRVLARSIDPLELLFKRLRGSMSDKGLSARARLVEDFVTRMVELGLGRVDLIRRQLITKKIASIAGVEWPAVSESLNQRLSRARVRSVSAAPAGGEAPTPAAPGALTPVTAAEHALACVLCEPALLLSLDEPHWAVLDPERFRAPHSRAIAVAVHDLYVHEEAASLSNVLATLEDENARRAATAFVAGVERAVEGKPERLAEHWRERLAQAYRELSAGAGGVAAGSDEWSTRIAALREQSATIGVDPRTIPRPMG